MIAVCAVAMKFEILAGCSCIVWTKEWREYLGGLERNHYSPLRSQIQCNPIIVDGCSDTMLPAGGFASTYEVYGRHYVVIACVGTKPGVSRAIVKLLLLCLEPMITRRAPVFSISAFSQ